MDPIIKREGDEYSIHHLSKTDMHMLREGLLHLYPFVSYQRINGQRKIQQLTKSFENELKLTNDKSANKYV